MIKSRMPGIYVPYFLSATATCSIIIYFASFRKSTKALLPNKTNKNSLFLILISRSVMIMTKLKFQAGKTAFNQHTNIAINHIGE